MKVGRASDNHTYSSPPPITPANAFRPQQKLQIYAHSASPIFATKHFSFSFFWPQTLRIYSRLWYKWKYSRVFKAKSNLGLLGHTHTPNVVPSSSIDLKKLFCQVVKSSREAPSEEERWIKMLNISSTELNLIIGAHSAEFTRTTIMFCNLH